MASQTTDAKTILKEWQTIAKDLDQKSSFILRQREIAADAIVQAKFLVLFPDHQLTKDKLAEFKNSFVATSKEDAVPFPTLPEEKKDQKFSVASAIQYAEESIQFHQDILAKLKQVQKIQHESPEEARALVRQIQELGQTRRKFINTHVANTGHASK